MKIVYLNPIGAVGGAERSLVDVFAAMPAMEPVWGLPLIAGAEGPVVEESTRLGVTAEVIAMPDELLVLGESSLRSRGTRIGAALRLLDRGARAAMGARRYAEQLRARLGELKPNLIHSNGIKFHLLTHLM